MDPKDIRTLRILEKVDEDHQPSQRDLARDLNISLGLVNSFIKRLAKKGYFKVTTIPKNRMRYVLTPKGAAEKTRLTYEYIQYSFQFYKEARKKLNQLFSDLDAEGVRTIVFYGASDLAEIAYLSIQESPIQLVAVVDDSKKNKKLMGMRVEDPAALDALAFERVLVTTLGSREAVCQKIMDKGISEDSIVMFQ